MEHQSEVLCLLYKGTGEKVNLSDLLGTVEKTSGTSNKTKKQLRNLQNSKETLELPLNKQQTEKVMKRCVFSSVTRSEKLRSLTLSF